ncbi:MAG: hypothetical protein WB819_14090 [Terriglobia bacterium]|jgi:hypothetical protein
MRFNNAAQWANIQRDKQNGAGREGPGTAAISMADGQSQPKKADVSYPRMRQHWR